MDIPAPPLQGAGSWAPPAPADSASTDAEDTQYADAQFFHHLCSSGPQRSTEYTCAALSATSAAMAAGTLAPGPTGPDDLSMLAAAQDPHALAAAVASARQRLLAAQASNAHGFAGREPAVRGGHNPHATAFGGALAPQAVNSPFVGAPHHGLLPPHRMPGPPPRYQGFDGKDMPPSTMPFFQHQQRSDDFSGFGAPSVVSRPIGLPLLTPSSGTGGLEPRRRRDGRDF